MESRTLNSQRVAPEAVAHLTSATENCLNYHLDPLTKTKIFPQAETHEGRLENWGSATGLVIITDSCAECGLKYTQHAFPLSRTDLLEKHGLKLEDFH